MSTRSSGMGADREADPDWDTCLPGGRADLLRALEGAGRQLSTATVLYHAAAAARLGLGPTDTKVLDLLERDGPLSAGDLARATGLAKPSVTGVVNRLVGKGFVIRRPDDRDGRRVVIAAAPESFAKVAAVMGAWWRELEAIYADFDDRELATILRFVRATAQRQSEAAAAVVAETAVRNDPSL